jgi:hypothetical protein
MRDFTHAAYRNYLEAIQAHYPNILRFDEYFSASPKPESFCLLKHDVDRRPYHALRMAELEHELGLRSTYYFRVKPHTFIPDVIRQIQVLGHEIGFHYESLSDSRGDLAAAQDAFAQSLVRLRSLVTVRTVAFHGRPFSPHDNRVLIRRMLQNGRFKELDLLGDATENVDYTGILYINDTGRNWHSDRSNVRDRVDSELRCDFGGGAELLSYFRLRPHPKVIFQVHPERWSLTPIDWLVQWIRDMAANAVKAVLSRRPDSIGKSER